MLVHVSSSKLRIIKTLLLEKEYISARVTSSGASWLLTEPQRIKTQWLRSGPRECSQCLYPGLFDRTQSVFICLKLQYLNSDLLSILIWESEWYIRGWLSSLPSHPETIETAPNENNSSVNLTIDFYRMWNKIWRKHWQLHDFDNVILVNSSSLTSTYIGPTSKLKADQCGLYRI